MENFSKLTNEEMRRINIGIPPVCNTQNLCAGPAIPRYPASSALGYVSRLGQEGAAVKEIGKGKYICRVFTALWNQ